MAQVVVTINGKKFDVEQRDLSYVDIICLAGYKPERVITVTVSRKGHEGKTLTQGGHVWPVDGMVINAYDTSNA